MKDAILNFGKQFDFVPEIKNKEGLKPFKHVVLLGMGGSHLAADVMKNLDSSVDMHIHSDYGLPDFSEEFWKESLVVASSYSGNTEEVIDGLSEALSRGLNCAIISVGGKLLASAKEKGLPYVEMPDIGIQPRSALGYSIVSLAYLLGNGKIISEIASVKGNIRPEESEEEGKKLAEDMRGLVPIIYSSNKNFSLAYNWKIKFNETGKIPAFYNVLPEMNHNEMTGFSAQGGSALGGDFSKIFCCIFLEDEKDHGQIIKRMKVSEKIYKSKGIKTIQFSIFGKNNMERMLRSLIIADWAAYYTALSNGAEPEKVPMVEEFKKMIS